jgi:hypothetical protein
MNKNLSPYSSGHPPLSPVKKRPRPYSSPLLGEKERGGGRKNDEAFYLRENERGGGNKKRICSKHLGNWYKVSLNGRLKQK